MATINNLTSDTSAFLILLILLLTYTDNVIDDISGPPPSHPLVETPLVPTDQLQLLKANLKQLKSYITEANKTLPKEKRLSKAGNKTQLCATIAKHYNIMLSSTNQPITPQNANTALDLAILQKQRDYCRSLAKEMMDSSPEHPFLLSSPNSSISIQMAPPQSNVNYDALNKTFEYIMVYSFIIIYIINISNF